MDIAALGIWIYNPTMFPFFAKLDTINTSREIPMWLIVIVLHFILLIISLILKHLHGEAIAYMPDRSSGFLKNRWVFQNCWMIISNIVGFVSLLTCIIVFTNAL